MATPLLPSDYVDLVSPLASGSDLRGRIVSIVPETDDAATLVIRPTQLGCTDRQYVRVGVDIDGVRHWRAYSLTSPPDRPDGNISITVKAIEQGLVSNFTVHRVEAGTVIQLDQATGEFTFDGSTGRNLSSSPRAAALPHCDRDAPQPHRNARRIGAHPFRFRATGEVIFRHELDGSPTGRIELTELHTDRVGMLDPVNGSDGADLAEQEIWTCGPTGMLDSIESP